MRCGFSEVALDAFDALVRFVMTVNALSTRLECEVIDLVSFAYDCLHHPDALVIRRYVAVDIETRLCPKARTHAIPSP